MRKKTRVVLGTGSLLVAVLLGLFALDSRNLPDSAQSDRRAGGVDVELIFRLSGAAVDPSANETQTMGVDMWRTVRASEIGLRASQAGESVDPAGFLVEADWDCWSRFLLDLETATVTRAQGARLLVDGDGKPRIHSERWGSRLDVRLLAERVAEVLAGQVGRPSSPLPQAIISVPVLPVRPTVLASQLQDLGISRLVASFLTSYDESLPNRSANIRLAAAAIEGRILYPGEELSFNEAVGPRNIEQGYREAPVIVNDQVISGLGGGICQVSTTLYNAALLAGLTVVERTPHSLPSSYVDLGRDATVAYGLLDLRLRNDLGFPVLLSALAQEGILNVSFYGPDTLTNQEVRVFAEKQRLVEREAGGVGTPMLRVRVWREISREGRTVIRELVSDDKYREKELSSI